MMKKISLMGMVLMFAGFIATAQNNIISYERFIEKNTRVEHSKIENHDLQIPKKTKLGEDWWEPDTVY